MEGLLNEKLTNFKQRFYHKALELGKNERLESATVDDIIGFFLTIKPLWSLIDSEDAESLIAFSGLTEGDTTTWIRPAWDNASAEERDLFTRYVKFFLHAVMEMQK